MKRAKKPPLLNARVQGEGPVVVLLHGFLSSSEYWTEVTKLAASKNTVVALDLLGFGKSPKPRLSKYDYDAHLASIEATLEHLNVTRPFTLVGHSMGSLLALRYARLHESSVNKLILVNMPLMLGKKQVRREILKTSLLYKYGLSSWSHRVVWTMFKFLNRIRALPPALRLKLRENAFFFQHSAESRIRSFQRVIASARADVDLASVNVRTQIVSGLKDREIYLRNLAHNVEVNANVALESIDTGHHIPRIRPESIIRHL